MSVRMLWMYNDLLDLYGDWGNLLILSRRLEEMGVESTLETASLRDTPDFTAYDLVYMGPGKARNLVAAAHHLVPMRQSVIEAIKSGTLFLVTGSARLLLGQSFRNEKTGEITEGLGLFPYTGVETGDMFISDVICTPLDSTEKVYGFINRTSYIEGNKESHWFETIRGAKDDDKPGTIPGAPKPGDGEGNRVAGVYSTWLLGPVLVKNPHLCRELLHNLVPDVPADYDDALAVEAWKRTIAEFE